MISDSEIIAIATSLGFPEANIRLRHEISPGRGPGEVGTYEAISDTITFWRHNRTENYLTPHVVAHEVFHWRQQLYVDKMVGIVRDKLTNADFMSTVPIQDYRDVLSEVRLTAVSPYIRTLATNAGIFDSGWEIVYWESMAELAGYEYDGKLDKFEIIAPKTYHAYLALKARLKQAGIL